MFNTSGLKGRRMKQYKNMNVQNYNKTSSAERGDRP